MAKKGKGGKKKQNKEDKKDSLPEVDKEYYEIQIADLNKKLTRLKQRCGELEKENIDLKKSYKALDEDRADIIAYLKRSIAQKHEEIKDVMERLQALNSAKITEKDKYEEQIVTMEKDFKTMHDTFTAEIKLLTGQLSSLESFKNNREAMVKRLIALEEELKKKDEHHALALRNNENKFILMKEKLSTYVEEKLLQLSLELQKKTQNRISESTHNVVKENIAINNELNLIIKSWQKLFDENEAFKQESKQLKMQLGIANEIKEKTLEKNIVQSQVLERLMYENTKMEDKFGTIYYYEQTNKILQQKVDESMKQMENSIKKAQELEVLNHSTKVELKELRFLYKTLKTDYNKLQVTIEEAVSIIKEVIGLQNLKRKTEISDEEEFTSRKQLLTTLLNLFESSVPFEIDDPFRDDFDSDKSDEFTCG